MSEIETAHNEWLWERYKLGYHRPYNCIECQKAQWNILGQGTGKTPIVLTGVDPNYLPNTWEGTTVWDDLEKEQNGVGCAKCDITLMLYAELRPEQKIVVDTRFSKGFYK